MQLAILNPTTRKEFLRLKNRNIVADNRNLSQEQQLLSLLVTDIFLILTGRHFATLCIWDKSFKKKSVKKEKNLSFIQLHTFRKM